MLKLSEMGTKNFTLYIEDTLCGETNCSRYFALLLYSFDKYKNDENVLAAVKSMELHRPSFANTIFSGCVHPNTTQMNKSRNVSNQSVFQYAPF